MSEDDRRQRPPAQDREQEQVRDSEAGCGAGREGGTAPASPSADARASAEAQAAALQLLDTAPRHEVRELTAGGTEAVIMLDGKSYLLRITRQGKLILTK